MNKWMNDIKFNEEQIEKSDRVKARYDICKSCDKFSDLKFCKSCGCFMPFKVRLASSSCPEGKWNKF